MPEPTRARFTLRFPHRAASDRARIDTIRARHASHVARLFAPRPTVATCHHRAQADAMASGIGDLAIPARLGRLAIVARDASRVHTGGTVPRAGP